MASVSLVNFTLDVIAWLGVTTIRASQLPFASFAAAGANSELLCYDFSLPYSLCLSTFASPPSVLIPSVWVTHRLPKKQIQWGPSVTVLCGALVKELSCQAPGELLTSLESSVSSMSGPRPAIYGQQYYILEWGPQLWRGAVGVTIPDGDDARLCTRWWHPSSQSHSSVVYAGVVDDRSWFNSFFLVVYLSTPPNPSTSEPQFTY